MARPFLRQTYWPNDREREREDKLTRLHASIDALDFDKGWDVVIERHVKRRGNKANNYLWGVVYKALAEHIGETPEVLHEHFCGEWFGWTEHTIFGRKELRPRRSTTKDEDGNDDIMEAVDFGAFIDNVIAVGTDSGAVIPAADPDMFSDYPGRWSDR